jgi:hypothetical protein
MAEAAEVGVVLAHTGVGGMCVESGNCFHKFTYVRRSSVLVILGKVSREELKWLLPLK